jgi:hypothetical protein
MVAGFRKWNRINLLNCREDLKEARKALREGRTKEDRKK